MLPPHAEMIRQLVATPSVSSSDARFDQSNQGVIDLVAQWASDLGFQTEITAVPDTDGKANLVATLGEGSDGLVLSGHTDTVPYNAERWTDDPFALTQRDGKLFGLGAADMKGFFAAALQAVSRVDRGRLRRPIVLLGTADEESTMAGARALVDRGEPLGRYAIIGEPTGLTPIKKHKGVLFVRITVGGKAGHASQPAEGVNAIEGIHEVMRALRAWRSGFETRYRDDEFEVVSPTLNFGRIAGGDSPNRIPDECTLDIDMRLLPGMRSADILDELRDQARTATDGAPWTVRVDAFGDYGAFGGPSDAGFQRDVETVCGCSAKTALFCTEAPYLTQMGLE
ncbi:MAG: acetylornithine deacetylase, partial [Polyangiales bacterium]